MRGLAIWGAAAIAGIGLAACSRSDDGVRADEAWVRLSPVPGRPAAAYVRLRGGREPMRLVAIDTPIAGSTELHESMADGGHGAMTMRRLDGLDVPAGGTVALSPGGNHLMLFGTSAALKPGARAPLTLRFAKGPPIVVPAKLVAAGDPAPY